MKCLAEWEKEICLDNFILCKLFVYYDWTG